MTVSTGISSHADPLLSQVEPESSRRLLASALDSFARIGFHATTTRDISTGAGLSAAAVYVHYASKADLLYELSKIGHAAVLETVEASLEQGDGPARRIWSFVASFSQWHAEHHTLARVAQYELGSLPPERLDGIIKLRRQFDGLVDRQLRAGVRTGDFTVSDLPGTRRAILSLGIDVARWYSPKDRREPSAIGELYADLVLRMLSTPTRERRMTP